MSATMTLGSMPVKRRTRRRSTDEDAANRFMVFLQATREWADANRDRLAKIYIVVEGSNYHSYLISKSVEHDFELTKSHCAFTLALLDATQIMTFGSQIPDGDFDELSAFLDPTRAFTMIPQ